MASSPRIRPLLVRLALAAWLGAMLAIGAGLLAKHTVALPAPAEKAALSRSLGGLRGAGDHGRWLAVHVLYAECRCSQRIVAHLLATTRPAGWKEIVLWVGVAAPGDELVSRFDVRRVTSAELAARKIEAAPSLVVLDPSDRVAYSGGYTDRKQGPVIDDLRIFDDALHAREPRTLPVLGCAVSDRLKGALAALPSF